MQMLPVKRRYFLILPIPLILIIAIVIFFQSRKTPVQAVRGPIVEAVYALGTVQSENSYNMKVGLTQRITHIYIKEGDPVKKGDALVALDLGSVLRAPFAGTVTRLFFKSGEVAIPGSVILTLQDLVHRYVMVSLDQESALSVHPGQKVEISVEGIRGRLFHGSVERIYPSAGQFFARIHATDLPPEILPDMTVDIAIEVARKENALIIPINAYHKGQVQVRRNARIENVPVKTGLANGEWIEITEGLNEGDSILLPDR